MTRALSIESSIQLNLYVRYDCEQFYQNVISSVTWTVSQTDQAWRYIRTLMTKEENENSMR